MEAVGVVAFAAVSESNVPFTLICSVTFVYIDEPSPTPFAHSYASRRMDGDRRRLEGAPFFQTHGRRRCVVLLHEHTPKCRFVARGIESTVDVTRSSSDGSVRQRRKRLA